MLVCRVGGGGAGHVLCGGNGGAVPFTCRSFVELELLFAEMAAAAAAAAIVDILLLTFNEDTLFTEFAELINVFVEYCSFGDEILLAEPKPVLVLAPALDGATLNGNVVKFVLDILRMGGGGGLIFGGLGGATVGRLIGGLGACLVDIFIESCD